MMLVTAALASLSSSSGNTPLPEKIPCAIADRQDFQSPGRVHLAGSLGRRVEGNANNRLRQADLPRLLEGFRKRPGRQMWDGEHVGKYLHAATLAWAANRDPELRKKIDFAAAELVKCQLEDGYLGTYTNDNRWTSWDVWVHKYNLIGLITYVRWTGNLDALPACRKMADLLCATFGEGPGKRTILDGNHASMAAGSILEPMVLLYRLTGEPRYLEFCNYVTGAWETPQGPKIVSTLLETKRVDKVGNAKAYEMLSCLNGLLELYRTLGDEKLLTACQNAWQDIVDHHLYITGTASSREVFRDPFDLPNHYCVGENCVTVTWLQFNAQLLRLTGEAKFAEQLEKTALNQLSGAQRPDGTAWCYFTNLEGKKLYSSDVSSHCCLSSGPRGMALLPTFSVSTDADGVAVNFYDAGTADLVLRNGLKVALRIETLYPRNGNISVSVEPETAATFALKMRIPAWSGVPAFSLNGKPVESRTGADGYAAITRNWSKRDNVEIQFKMEPRVVPGSHGNAGKVALMYGPLVLAMDESLLEPKGLPIQAVSLGGIPDPTNLQMTEQVSDGSGNPSCTGAFRLKAISRLDTPHVQTGDAVEALLIPFAQVGAAAERYKVWLPLRQGRADNLLLSGLQSQSRSSIQGSTEGSMIDEDSQSFLNTSNGKNAEEDWFAVTLKNPAKIARVIYMQGKTSPEGGWFDASSAKPRIQIQTGEGGPWKEAAELKDYPATTATFAARLIGGEAFTCDLPAPARIFGIRVIGKPAAGNKPEQAYSSCAELQAFEK